MTSRENRLAHIRQGLARSGFQQTLPLLKAYLQQYPRDKAAALLLVEAALKHQQYDQALQGYRLLHQYHSAVFRPGHSQSLPPVHLHNAANLARRAGYDAVAPLRQVSERLARAIDHFFRLRPQPFADALQRPSFFYLPDLPARPFWPASAIDGLDKWVCQTAQFRDAILRLLKQSQPVCYLDNIHLAPKGQQWDKLRQDTPWQSLHLRQGQQLTALGRQLPQPLQQLLQSPLLAHCPPHAPEAFVSILHPGAHIPPHVGLSNIKLTLHIPLQVNKEAHITVGGQQRYWSGHDYLLFDDSYEHQAINPGNEPRSVLIVDLWHPDLTTEERRAIATFMQQHQQWAEQYGQLAVVDAPLHMQRES